MIILITGGANSGKTHFAISSAMKYPKERVYIATGVPIDDEMSQKIKKHQKERGTNFKTWEEPYNIISLLRNITPNVNVLVLDCLTTWTANILLKGGEPLKLAKEFLNFLQNVYSILPFFIVTNEVGMGIVPNNELSRKYREVLGEINILFAKSAKEVYFMVAGIPLRVK